MLVTLKKKSGVVTPQHARSCLGFFLVSVLSERVYVSRIFFLRLFVFCFFQIRDLKERLSEDDKDNHDGDGGQGGEKKKKKKDALTEAEKKRLLSLQADVSKLHRTAKSTKQNSTSPHTLAHMHTQALASIYICMRVSRSVASSLSLSLSLSFCICSDEEFSRRATILPFSFSVASDCKLHPRRLSFHWDRAMHPERDPAPHS